MALENTLEDCKAECRINDGCEGFVMSADTRCINIRDINLEMCEHDPEFIFYRHGKYEISFMK